MTLLSFRGVVLTAILVGIAAVVAGLLLGFPVMLLWNALMPDIFGLKPINFWQALGLVILSTILFKGSSSKN